MWLHIVESVSIKTTYISAAKFTEVRSLLKYIEWEPHELCPPRGYVYKSIKREMRKSKLKSIQMLKGVFFKRASLPPARTQSYYSICIPLLKCKNTYTTTLRRSSRDFVYWRINKAKQKIERKLEDILILSNMLESSVSLWSPIRAPDLFHQTLDTTHRHTYICTYREIKHNKDQRTLSSGT